MIAISSHRNPTISLFSILWFHRLLVDQLSSLQWLSPPSGYRSMDVSSFQWLFMVPACSSSSCRWLQWLKIGWPQTPEPVAVDRWMVAVVWLSIDGSSLQERLSPVSSVAVNRWIQWQWLPIDGSRVSRGCRWMGSSWLPVAVGTLHAVVLLGCAFGQRPLQFPVAVCWLLRCLSSPVFQWQCFWIWFTCKNEALWKQYWNPQGKKS